MIGLKRLYVLMQLALSQYLEITTLYYVDD